MTLQVHFPLLFLLVPSAHRCHKLFSIGVDDNKGHARAEPWLTADKDRILPVEKFHYGSIANPPTEQEQEQEKEHSESGAKGQNEIVVDDKLRMNIQRMLKPCHEDFFSQLINCMSSHSLSPSQTESLCDSSSNKQICLCHEMVSVSCF